MKFSGVNSTTFCNDVFALVAVFGTKDVTAASAFSVKGVIVITAAAAAAAAAPRTAVRLLVVAYLFSLPPSSSSLSSSSLAKQREEEEEFDAIEDEQHEAPERCLIQEEE